MVGLARRVEPTKRLRKGKREQTGRQVRKGHGYFLVKGIPSWNRTAETKKEMWRDAAKLKAKKNGRMRARGGAVRYARRVYRLPARCLESEAHTGTEKGRRWCVERAGILFLSGCEQILPPSSGRASPGGIARIPDFPAVFEKSVDVACVCSRSSDSRIYQAWEFQTRGSFFREFILKFSQRFSTVSASEFWYGFEHGWRSGDWL